MPDVLDIGLSFGFMACRKLMFVKKIIKNNKSYPFLVIKSEVGLESKIWDTYLRLKMFSMEFDSLRSGSLISGEISMLKKQS